MVDKIKFGTDGWRAIIAKDYTVNNVARVATATAKWMNKQDDPSGNNSRMVLGFDCRFGGAMFAEVTAKIACTHGIKVFMDKHFVSTPMISLAANKLSCHTGIIITASHNPPSYNGYKIKAGHGGPAVQASINEVEGMIEDTAKIPETSLEEFEKQGLIEYVNLEEMYFKHVSDYFNLDLINNSGIKVGYDAMYGAGQNVFKRLVPDAVALHCEYNPSFYGQAPEPIHKNLLEFSNTIKEAGDIEIGIANDGDADRIGVYDSKGKFIDAHHVILLLIHILYKYKGLTGKVVVAFSVSDKVKKLCAAYGIEVQITQVGFKYICEIMKDEDVLVGGEESGGIAVKGHIPERDGIWDGLVLLEYMAESGKSVDDLIQEVYDVVGAFSYNRNDLHITNDLKWQIMDNCKNGTYKTFGTYTVERVEDIDGYKFFTDKDCCVMIRPSGTEPVLRVYGQAPTADEVEDLLAQVRKTLLS